jgi:hypothetical protein
MRELKPYVKGDVESLMKKRMLEVSGGKGMEAKIAARAERTEQQIHYQLGQLEEMATKHPRLNDLFAEARKISESDLTRQGVARDIIRLNQKAQKIVDKMETRAARESSGGFRSLLRRRAPR